MLAAYGIAAAAQNMLDVMQTRPDPRKTLYLERLCNYWVASGRGLTVSVALDGKAGGLSIQFLTSYSMLIPLRARLSLRLVTASTSYRVPGVS
jgi:hypothetical protein